MGAGSRKQEAASKMLAPIWKGPNAVGGGGGGRKAKGDVD